MSDFFKDKTYDSMNWLNKAIEPYEYSKNTIIQSLPEKIDISDLIITNISVLYHSSTIVDDEIMAFTYKKLNISEISLLEFKKCYIVEIPDDSTIDFVNNAITNPPYLSKVVEPIDEKNIGPFLEQQDIIKSIAYNSDSSTEANKRVKELMDILDMEKNHSRRVSSNIYALNQRFIDKITTNKWNIKNVDLIIRLMEWISSYIATGNLAAIANISKLKCMIHNGAPIYSMEEII